jgi:hypothetical protein
MTDRSDSAYSKGDVILVDGGEWHEVEIVAVLRVKRGFQLREVWAGNMRNTLTELERAGIVQSVDEDRIHQINIEDGVERVGPPRPRMSFDWANYGLLAFIAGFNAAKARKSIHQNPWTPSHPGYEFWREGWITHHDKRAK